MPARHNPVQNFNLNTELLDELAHQSLLRSLPGFDLSAGELPQPTHRSARPPLCGKHKVAVEDHCSNHIDVSGHVAILNGSRVELPSISKGPLELGVVDDVAQGLGGVAELLQLVGVEAQLDDVAHAAAVEDGGGADVEVLEPVLAFE